MKQLRFSVLGALTMHAGGPVDAGPFKQRLTVATLLARPNTTVPVETLSEAVWADGQPPRSARKNLQVYVSNLRRLLDLRAGAADRLVHENGGYRLRVTAKELDSLYFRELITAGRNARIGGATVPAVQHFRQAFKLWRDTPFTGLHRSPVLAAEAQRLIGRRLQAFEDWAELELELGNNAVVADTVSELAERYPQRERLRAAQMTALYRCGRQTEALQVFEEVRRQLATEYGLPPTPTLQEAYDAMIAERHHRGAAPAGTGPTAAGLATGHAVAAAAVLPPPAGHFVGRDQQLAKAAELLRGRTRPLIVLAGAAGIGKTALAVHLAHQSERAYPDGRLLVRMRDGDGRPRPTREILAQLCEWCGRRPTGDPEQDLRAWRRWVGQRRVLLIFDHVDGDDLGPLLPTEGTSAVLVTTRRPVAVPPHADRIDVPCLAPSEAVDLLAHVVGSERVERDRAAAYDVVAGTGLLPLAVHVGGLKLATMRFLSLRDYADRLAAGPPVLDQLTDDGSGRPYADSWYRGDAAAGPPGRTVPAQFRLYAREVIEA
ncbi:AfsR/SARP family transcriptional regulator [Plantactinospora sp. KBS50]|uniref:AfsR/SARP family transcriptional regulator n=1 Tax=Plantactinospora sp. KBS50 TaxID=2024580 RepID=UPI000BAAFFF5|nr:AfsR/SARP family transcriptional regulator [Plantactinospora sp. KBS50]ASW55630.1 hypothetical protein CIK06_17755 [Plantactinospora sp. KBS50]